ncbi:hypothetical protein BSLG_003590 [Batrachochytrium salamandrivorans]|nr:hypothetical protein BSLG_003590 [Batrachochytrium salamandrivorans]
MQQELTKTSIKYSSIVALMSPQSMPCCEIWTYFHNPEFNNATNHHLNQAANLLEQIRMSIAALVRMCQVITNPSTSLVLLGNGALTALLTLIPRAIAWPDVLANINILVNVIVTENPSAEQLIIKHGGISLLLKAADQSSKAYLEMKILTEKNTNEISQGIPFDTLIDSSIVRDSKFLLKSSRAYHSIRVLTMQSVGSMTRLGWLI